MEQKNKSVLQRETPAGQCAHPSMAVRRVSGTDGYSFQRDRAPGEARSPDALLRRYAVQNSKCRFWCRLQRHAPFISLLNWTEDGLKTSGSTPDPTTAMS